MKEFNVVVGAPTLMAHDEDLIDDLLDVLVLVAGDSSVTATDGRITARFDVSIETGLVVDATSAAVSLFSESVRTAGFPVGDIDAVDVKPIELFAAEMDEPAETYAGVSEVAAMFHVSRQRISELRTSRGFPAPVAELAAGPVWTVSSLSRFLDTWERKPGRPRKVNSKS